ncbi:hypothetical protein [Streptomyces sp. NPDC001292]|uniref:hypothetical protein n=1 Tax=Streptomyces sp. NPDC001292 TaxID=3364558 RepID=UPI0036CFC4C5
MSNSRLSSRPDRSGPTASCGTRDTDPPEPRWKNIMSSRPGPGRTDITDTAFPAPTRTVT